jgi:hypothetical protein
MQLRKVNVLIQDFLGDLLKVFPDSYNLGQAKLLVSSAVELDENSPLPMLFFLSGHPPPKLKDQEKNQDQKQGQTQTQDQDSKLMTFPRAMLGITCEGWSEMFETCSEGNKAVITKYLNVIEKAILRMGETADELADTQRKFMTTDCYHRLKQFATDTKTCDEILHDSTKLYDLLEKMQHTPGFKELREASEFVITRIFSSPELIMKMMSHASEAFSSSSSSENDDNDSDDDNDNGNGNEEGGGNSNAMLNVLLSSLGGGGGVGFGGLASGSGSASDSGSDGGGLDASKLLQLAAGSGLFNNNNNDDNDNENKNK